jgi:hypothetical protein
MTPQELDQLARETISDMAQPLVEAGDPDPQGTLLLNMVKLCIKAGLIERNVNDEGIYTC